MLLHMSLCTMDNPSVGPHTCSGNFTREAVDAERAVNKAIGDGTGCWKAGVLVEDDAGSVKKALNEVARIVKSRH